MPVAYHKHHAEIVRQARSLYTNFLFSFSKLYSVFMTSHPGGATLSTVHEGPYSVGDITAQTQQVLDRIEETLRQSLAQTDWIALGSLVERTRPGISTGPAFVRRHLMPCRAASAQLITRVLA